MFSIESTPHGKYFLIVTFASVFSLLFVIIDDNAYAMGPPPYACKNLYDSVFTSIWIQSGGITYNPILTPGVVIPVQNGVGYKYNYTLHTSPVSVGINTWFGINNQSAYGPNTNPGTTWFWNSADQGLGYMQGSCVAAGPNQDIASPTFTDKYYLPEGDVRLTSWGTAISGIPNYAGQTSYFLIWTDSPVVAPPSDAPRNLYAYAVSSSQINLGWDAPIINYQQGLVPGYKIERSTDNGSTWSTLVANTNSTTRHYSDTGLVRSTTYFYRVSEVTLGVSSSPSNWAGATTYNVVPSAPVSLIANAFNSSQIDLSWTVPNDDGGAPITGYEIERSTDNGSTWSVIISNTNSTGTTYSDAGLSPNTTYTYRVSAINSIGTSSPSNTASATTLS